MITTCRNQILVATDLLDLDSLLPVAIEQAKAAEAILWLLHVIGPDHTNDLKTHPLLRQESLSRKAETTLATLIATLRQQNVPCAYEIRHRHPVEQVIDFVHEHQTQRLLLGTSGKKKLTKLVLGSVAEQLIRSLDIPVCTVGPHYNPVPRSNPRRVLFATSMHHQAVTSVRFAADLAAELGAELTVLHVMEQHHLDDGVNLRVVPKIDEMLKSVQSANRNPRLRIRYGEPAEEILAECSALQPELLVLGALPASRAAAAFRTGIAYQVIAQAPCPTFTLRSECAARPGADSRLFSTTHSIR